MAANQEENRDMFFTAVKNGDVNKVELMLGKNLVDINDRCKFGEDGEGWTALMIACWKGHYALVKLLLKKGAEVNLKDDKGWFALKRASFNNHYEVVELLLEHGAEVNLQNNHGWTALMNASKHGHYRITKLLLERGADPNIQRKSGRSSLMSASENGRYQEVELLLVKHAEVNMKDKYGRTALTYASICGHSKVVELLITEDAEVDSQDNDGMSALMKSCAGGQYKVAQLLLEKGARIDLQTKKGWPALMFAIERGHNELVKLLLHSGAAVDILSEEGESPLDLAQRMDLVDHSKIDDLLEKEVTVRSRPTAANHRKKATSATIPKTLAGEYMTTSAKNLHDPPNREDGSTSSAIYLDQPTHIEGRATSATNMAKPHREDEDTSTNMEDEIISTTGLAHERIFVRTTCKSHEMAVVKETSDDQIRSMFITAVEQGDIDQVKILNLLHEKIIDINDHYKFHSCEGWSALMIACWNGHHNLAEFLLLKCAQVNLQNDKGQSALICASRNGHFKVVELLLKSGALVNQQDYKEWSALKKASFSNHYEIVELLLEHGATVDLQDDHGWTALMNACKHGNCRLVKLLLEKRADPNIQRKSGRSALMSASESGRYQVVEMLLDYGVHVNMKDHDYGQTALTYASYGGHSHVSHLLITEGALVDSQDNEGRSALMIAINGEQCEMIQLLLKEGARVDLCDNEGQSALTLAMKLKHHELQAAVSDKVSVHVEEESPSSSLKKQSTLKEKTKEMLKKLFPVLSQPSARKKYAYKCDGGMVVQPQLYLQRLSSSPPLTPNSWNSSVQKKVDLSASTAPFIHTKKSYTCDQHGTKLSIDDITVTIPPGAIPDGVTVHIEMGVALYGPFEFPDNHQPVSPILWFCIQEEIELLLPITYRLPHIITDIRNVKLVFAKASHLNSAEALGFVFKILPNNDPDFTCTNPLIREYGYGHLSTKHCCYLCITAKISEKLALERGYCLHTLIKKDDDSSYQILLLCTYYLDTCIQALKISYPDKLETQMNGGYKYYEFEPFQFKDPCLVIKPTSEDDLKIKIKSRSKIQESKVNFWGEKIDQMKLKYDYPPKVTIIVYSNSCVSRKAEVTLVIDGMRKPYHVTVVETFTAAIIGDAGLARATANPHLDQILDYDNEVERDLIKIAHNMLDWEEKLCTHLGLTQVDVHDITDINKDKPVLQRREALRRWKSSQGLGATYQNLLELFMNAEHWKCVTVVYKIQNDARRQNPQKQPL